jgi:hypothetical protein
MEAPIVIGASALSDDENDSQYWSGSEGHAEAQCDASVRVFKNEDERRAYLETHFKLKHLKATFDNTPGLRRALHIVHADHASLYGVYILDIRYAFAGVDGYVSRAASELARHFSTRHVHVLENENDDSALESFLGVLMSDIPSFPVVYVASPTGVFLYQGHISSTTARHEAVANIQNVF